jgi:hypothetical protein
MSVITTKPRATGSQAYKWWYLCSSPIILPTFSKVFMKNSSNFFYRNISNNRTQDRSLDFSVFYLTEDTAKLHVENHT